MSKLSKFKKALEKKDTFNLGLSPVRDWISTGNAGLNNILSGDMRKGVAVGRVTGLAGLNGTGKSFLLANIIREAQHKGYFCIYLDSEYATSDGFMEKIGVDMDEEKFMAVNTSILEEVIEFSSLLFKNTDPEDKILFAIDSLSNLQMANDEKKYDEGKAAYGQGLREKMLKQIVTNLNSKCGDRNIAILFSSHEYVAGQDAYGNPILKPNVGEGTMYLPSSVVRLSKKDLREGKEVTGISVKCKMIKSRFTKNGSECEFSLPWNAGMDFLDGALEVLEEAGTVQKNAAWYSYTNQETGEVVKFQRSNFNEHADILLDYYGEREIEEKTEEEAHTEYVDATN